MDSIQKAVMKIAHSVTDQKELIIKEWMEINGEIISEYTDIYCVDGIIKRLNEIYELRVENERLRKQNKPTIRNMLNSMRLDPDIIQIRINNNVIIQIKSSDVDAICNEILDKKIDNWFCSYSDMFGMIIVFDYVSVDPELRKAINDAIIRSSKSSFRED